MRTKKNIRAAIVAGTLLMAGQAFGQASVPGNTGGFGDFSGWDANTFQALDVKHEGNFPIKWWTDNVQHMRLNQTMNTGVGFPTPFPGARDGFLLLSGQPDAFTNPNSHAPFSRLHLVDNVGTTAPLIYAQEVGYRDWMRNGITFTGNADQGYIGQKYGGPDVTDMVIQWSDNANGDFSAVDRLKFVFTGSYLNTPSGRNSLQGVEAMRFWPASANSVNVGIGDYGALNNDPTEQLDILSGKVKIRQLLSDMVSMSNEFVTVNTSTGVLEHRPLSGTDLCASGWSLQGNNTVTAFNGNTCPPQNADAVGIGRKLSGGAPAKLNVTTNNYATGQLVNSIMATTTNTGFAVRMSGGTAKDIGVNIRGSGSGTDLTKIGIDVSIEQGACKATRGVVGYTNGATNIAVGGDFASNDNAVLATGVQGLSRKGSTASIGVQGRSYATATRNIGVYAYHGVDSANTSTPVGNYGLFATTSGNVNGTDWAGWFQGRVTVNGSGYIPAAWNITSDGNLKTNVEDLANATELLEQLQPKRYDFLVEEHPEIALPTGTQLGLIAQEVETILPEWIKQVVIPATYDDSTGVQLTPSEEIKTMNYIGLIPLLIAGFKEQSVRIDYLEAQISQCCASQGQGMAPNNGGQRTAPVEELQKQRLLIIPNPVADLTTLEYYVPKAGQVSLQVSTSDGKPLSTLREELAEAGTYNYAWNTTKLAAGTYFCTFMLDGAVVVKRAVKVK
ncbi:MAG: tail fiber domain-containing protein [Flavobacteriales bacterium]